MPYGQQPGTPAPPGGPPGYGWRYAASTPPTPPRRSKGLAAAVAAAIVLATAALVVGIVDLTRSSTPGAPAASAPTTSVSPADTTAANRALCNAIAPLMAEDDQRANAWIATGAPGTPARDTALPKFRTDTEDWAHRVQDVQNAHLNAEPFLKRTLQRFIDDRVLLVRNMRPGPAKQYDDEAWSDSMTAYGGPLSVCGGLGIKW